MVWGGILLCFFEEIIDSFLVDCVQVCIYVSLEFIVGVDIGNCFVEQVVSVVQVFGQVCCCKVCRSDKVDIGMGCIVGVGGKFCFGK